MLEIRGIDVSYGDLQVLWDVSFRVDEGEVVVLVGANGAGKSTVLKTISALLTPGRGEILLEGKAIHGAPPHQILEHGIAHVPEGRRIFPEMTVEENLIMGALGRRAKGRRAETMKRVFGLFPRLEERRRQSAGTLSGGEQQMLAVGRGLMSLPRILMLDEPSLGLAPILVQEILEIVRNVRREGVTVLLVEQNVHLTLALCDRAYVLENGRVALEGTGEELQENPHIRQAYLGI